MILSLSNIRLLTLLAPAERLACAVKPHHGRFDLSTQGLNVWIRKNAKKTARDTGGFL